MENRPEPIESINAMTPPSAPLEPATLLSIQVATLNLHKMEEMNSFLKVQPQNTRFQFVMNPEAPEVEEIGENFLDNARLKAQGCALLSGCHWVLGDDSGLVIPALSGTQGLPEFPGIYSNRWFGAKERQEILGQSVHEKSPVSVQERNQAILSLMQGKINRLAYYVCALVLWDRRQDDLVFQVESKMPVWITPSSHPVGTGGFGYDPISHPIFSEIPEGDFLSQTRTEPQWESITVAQMSVDEKNRYSHRGKSLTALVKFLKKNF